MGANYDIVISSCGELDAFLEHVFDLVAERYSVDGVLDLADADIVDERAFFVGVPCSGWIQLLASAAGIGCPLEEWFHDNPVARALSKFVRYSFHAWSLDSGYVAGYSLFESGAKSECTTVFTKEAKDRSSMMDGVPILPSVGRGRLGFAIGQPAYDFSADVAAQRNLELGFAGFIWKFGFPVHLVDFYDAVDEKSGSQVVNGTYRDVPLTGWKAIVFH